MSIAGLLIRRERLARAWSQEGLCRGICGTSYLSKIEQGKAAASEEILTLLLARLGLSWTNDEDGALRAKTEACMEALILGMMCFLGMLIFGFPYAAVVSLLLGVMALIPFFGAWIGGATAAVLVASVDPFKGVMMVVFIVVLQQIEGNLIYPRVVGSTIGMPGLLVMVAVIMGQGLFGVFGILISVPLCAVCYTLLKQHLDDAPAPAESGEAPLKM